TPPRARGTSRRPQFKRLVHYPRGGNSSCRQKGNLIVANHGVFSRDVRSPFIPPTPKPDIAVPNAGPPLGDGGEDAPSGNIDRPRMGGKNGRLKASGIDVAAPNVARPLKPRKCSLPRRNPPTPVRRRPARASAQRVIANFFQRPKTGLEPSRVVLYPFAQHSVRHGDPLERYGGRYNAPPLASRH